VLALLQVADCLALAHLKQLGERLIVEWEALQAPTLFAEALNSELAAVHATETFLRQWTALKVSEKRQLVDQVRVIADVTPINGAFKCKCRRMSQSSPVCLVSSSFDLVDESSTDQEALLSSSTINRRLSWTLEMFTATVRT